MELMLREVTEVVVNIFGADFEGVVESLPFRELGEGGGAGNGRGTTVGFPAEIFDRIGFGIDLDVHFHLVAADGVADGADGVSLKLRFVAHEEVAGVQKVIPYDVGVDPILTFLHRTIISRQVAYGFDFKR